MKKLFIVVAALFAMSAFAADTTTTPPADAGMAKDSGAMSKEAPAAKTKKAKKDKKAAKKAEKAADAPAATGEAK
jgi:hypothetical protein